VTMTIRRPGKRDQERTETGQLAELVRCERELEGLWVREVEEGRARVEAARATAAEAFGTLQASFEQEADRLRAGIREEAREQADRMLAEAAERAARFDGMSDEEIERLAQGTFRRLLGPGVRS